MRGKHMSVEPPAGRKKGLKSAALSALFVMALAAGPLPLRADETGSGVQPLKEAIRAGGSKPARFILKSGETVIGRIVRIDDDALLIRRPSAGLLSLPLIDITAVKIKSADGEFRLGQLQSTPDGGIGWIADSGRIADNDRTASTEVASVEIDAQIDDAQPDKGGPLIRLDTDIVVDDDDDVEDIEIADVKLTKLEDPDVVFAPDAAQSPGGSPVRLVVTTDETNESDKLMYFRLTLSEPATQSVLIIYTMINGSAVAPGDYTHRQGVVVFEPGQTQAVIATSIINDDANEGAESFTFFVTGDPSAVVIDERKIAATITDDDG